MVLILQLDGETKRFQKTEANVCKFIDTQFYLEQAPIVSTRTVSHTTKSLVAQEVISLVASLSC